MTGTFDAIDHRICRCGRFILPIDGYCWYCDKQKSQTCYSCNTRLTKKEIESYVRDYPFKKCAICADREGRS